MSSFIFYVLFCSMSFYSFLTCHLFFLETRTFTSQGWLLIILFNPFSIWHINTYSHPPPSPIYLHRLSFRIRINANLPRGIRFPILFFCFLRRGPYSPSWSRVRQCANESLVQASLPLQNNILVQFISPHYSISCGYYYYCSICGVSGYVEKYDPRSWTDFFCVFFCCGAREGCYEGSWWDSACTACACICCDASSASVYDTCCTC